MEDIEVNLNKYKIVPVLILILILSACSPVGNTASNEMEGIELELIINKQKYHLMMKSLLL